MTSAVELLANPELDIPAVTASTNSPRGYTHDELALFRIGHDDINLLALTIYNFAAKNKDRKLNIRPNVLEAIIEDSIDQTPTFAITIHDPTWELLNTGALDHTIDINPGRIPHRWYRLDNISVNNDDIQLVFSTRNAVYLSTKKRPRKANRKRMTRAEFIKSLLREVKKTRIKMYCPQLHQKQKIGKTRFDSEPTRKRNRDKGFTDSDKVTVNNVAANPTQIRTIEQVCQAGLDVGAPSLVIVSAVMCVYVESSAGAHTTGNPPYVGPFQQNHADGWPGTGNAYKDAKGNGKLGVKQGGYYGMAIPAFKQHPNQDLGVFVQKVQGALGSLNPLNSDYAMKANKARSEAEHAVKAFDGGIDVPTSTSSGTNYKKKYEFNVGPPDGRENENYLEAMYRLAEEVHWRAYWVKDVLHFMSEEDLFRAKARKRLRRGEDGVESITFEWDRGKLVNEMRLNTRMERWVCPVGTVVIFDEGGPAQGRWLVTNIRRSIFNELGEITLRKPQRERKEPANDPGTRNAAGPGGAGGLGGAGGAITGGSLADVKVTWTPQQIIERIVVPMAKAHGMVTGTSAASVRAANARHSINSWHKGPGNLAWATDMSNGYDPTPQMDDLASELIMAFDLPDLVDPLATRADGSVAGNLVNAYHKGFHFQLIYRTWLSDGGDHYNHVHFGAKREGPVRPG